MAPVGFEPAIPANERPQTHILYSAATGISYWGAYVFLKTCCLRLVLCLFRNDPLVTHAPEHSGTSVYCKRNYGHRIMENVIACAFYSHISMDCPLHRVPEHDSSMS